MINKKLAAAFLVPLMAASIGAAKATETDMNWGCDDCSATTCVTAVLQDVCEMKLNGGNVCTKIVPCSGVLETALTPSFKFTSSAPRKLELTARVQDTVSKKDALFQQSGVKYLVLGNDDVKPTPLAVASCKSILPVESFCKNVIAYPISSVQASGATTGAFNYSSSLIQDNYNANCNAGDTVVTLTTGTNPRSGTYGFGSDQAGEYKAEITLSAVSI